MLGKFGWWRHAVVGATIAGCGLLAALGVIGSGPGERFESKMVVVQPAGGDALEITEVVDIDFGSDDRHGYERLVNNDFGVPIDVSAASPDAPDDVSVVNEGAQTRIRVGRSDTTVSGQHRYVLRYTLPAAQVSTGQLALDIIGNDEQLETERFEVVVTGMDLDAPLCNVGSEDDSGGCQLVAGDGDYRAVIAPLEPGDGITIGGTIVAITEPVDVIAPPLPERRDDSTLPLTVGIVALGITGAAAVYGLSRRRGRNEVFGGGGAADAAFGALPAPGSPIPAQMSTTMVADSKLASLATIEFVPPPGIAPWQGAAVLYERLDDSVVAAWFSGQAADDVIVLDQDDGTLVVRPGPKLAQADPATAEIVETMLHGRESITLGKYDKHFASAWRKVTAIQRAEMSQSGWWTKMPAFGGAAGGGFGLVVLVIVGFVVFGAGSAVTAMLGAVRSVPLALLFGLVVPSVAAWSMYSVLLPARSGTGSAMALRTESFRRFLDASEGRHVEWAWKQGLLREYSAWAVSLGAAGAWGRALASSNVPEPDIRMNTPLLVYSMGSSISSSRTAPSSSGSGGSSGGFSGGSVGGGGGGGSSGSW